MGLHQGAIFTEEHKKNISLSKIGNNNSMWKGNDASYGAIHDWVKRYKPKSELCEKCRKVKPNDIANISGKYKRDITDYKWLCRKCHMESDGRLNNFKTMPHMKGSSHGMAILNEDKVRKIKVLLTTTNKLTPIAKEFNVSPAVISQIKRGINWNHIHINQKEVITI